MNIQEKKLDLIRWLTSLNNDKIVNKVYDIKKSNVTNDWYDDLSNAQKQSISEGLDDLNKGNVVSHEDVMRSINQKIAELKNS